MERARGGEKLLKSSKYYGINVLVPVFILPKLPYKFLSDAGIDIERNNLFQRLRNIADDSALPRRFIR